MARAGRMPHRSFQELWMLRILRWVSQPCAIAMLMCVSLLEMGLKLISLFLIRIRLV